MSEIKVKGSSVTDIRIALGLMRSKADIELSFRQNDYKHIKLPGLEIRVNYGTHLSRDISTLEEAISYIRKLYREHHNAK